MNEPVCADSSVLLKLSLPEPDTAAAVQLLDRWTSESRDIVAPSLLAYEITSVLRLAAHRGRISAEEAEQGLEDFFRLQVTLYQTPGLHQRALDLAAELDLPVAYDAHYLALAEALECEFWTADARLHSAIRERFPLIRLLA